MENKDSLPDIRVGLQFSHHKGPKPGEIYTIYEIEDGEVWINWEGDEEGTQYEYNDVVDYIKKGVWTVINDNPKQTNPIPEKWCVLQDRKEVNDWFNENSQSGYRSFSSITKDTYLHYPKVDNAHSHYSIQEHYTLITYEQFKAITNQMNKKILGYIAPTQLWGEEVPKGSLYAAVGDNFNYGVKNDIKENSYYLPKEIVETWEPVYEPTETILKLGDKNIEVKIGKGYIQADGKEFNPEHLEELFQSITAISTLNGYSVEVTGVKVGCTEFKPVELNEILNTYKELNNETIS